MALRAVLTVAPGSAPLPAEAFSVMDQARLRQWVDRCGAAAAPGCVIMLGQFSPGRDQDTGYVFVPREDGKYQAWQIYQSDDLLYLRGQAWIEGRPGDPVSPTTVASLARGEFRLAPSSRRSLWIGETEFFPDN